MHTNADELFVSCLTHLGIIKSELYPDEFKNVKCINQNYNGIYVDKTSGIYAHSFSEFIPSINNFTSPMSGLIENSGILLTFSLTDKIKYKADFEYMLLSTNSESEQIKQNLKGFETRFLTYYPAFKTYCSIVYVRFH